MIRAGLATLLLASACGGAPTPCPACPACPAQEAPTAAPERTAEAPADAPSSALFVRVEGPRGYAEATMPPLGATAEWGELMERVGMSRMSCDATRDEDDRWTITCWRGHQGLPMGAAGPRFSGEIACSATPRDGFHGSVEMVDERLTPVRPEHPHGREAERALIRARCEP